MNTVYFVSITIINQNQLCFFSSEETPFLSPAEDLFRLYDGVQTFVLFIGYPRSSHSLVGAILDAHPEIIIPHEYNLVGRWKDVYSPRAARKNLQKYMLFYELQELSRKQAMFGIRANNSLLSGVFTYTYNVPGLWQGGYYNRIKVYPLIIVWLIWSVGKNLKTRILIGSLSGPYFAKWTAKMERPRNDYNGSCVFENMIFSFE